jgi:signal transduction histidine kinase
VTRRSGVAGRLAALAPRRWSIGLRTAVTFGAVSAALAALVAVLVSTTTTAGITVGLTEIAESSGPPATPLAPGDAACDAGRCATTELVQGADGRPVAATIRDVVVAQQWPAAALGVALAAVVAGLVGWFVSRRLLRPLDAVVATTRLITASTLHERIALHGPRDEIARVAETIDDLLDRLEAAFEAQRRFVADASHELRTPLAVQRAAIQIGLDDPTPAELERTKRQLLDANRRSEALLESLLALATADRGLADAGREVGVGDVVDEVVTGLLDRARASSVEVIVARGTFGRVRGDEVLVGQLVRNLVANAVEYNEPGGWVRVHGGVAERDGPGAVLVVENTGPVVREREAATLIRAFVRGAGRQRPRRGPGPGARRRAAQRPGARDRGLGRGGARLGAERRAPGGGRTAGHGRLTTAGGAEWPRPAAPAAGGEQVATIRPRSGG